jgi:hypothetical protein
LGPRSSVALLASIWQRHGIAGVWSLVHEKLHPDTRSLVLLGLSNPVFLPDLEPGAGVDHRFATRDEVERLPLENRAVDSLAIFDRGDRCLLQTVDRRLAGIVWVSTAPVVQLYAALSLSLPANAVYTFRTWTTPACRGRGLQGRRHLAVLAALRAEGRSRLLCFATSTNFASLRGARKSGCRPIGTIRMSRSGDPRPRVKIWAPAWSDVTLARP